MAEIVSKTLVVGLEVHVELATRTKMFSRAASPACAEFDGAEPNTLIDELVLGLPGALPVLNERAIEMAMLVGLALGCRIAEYTKWDRKSYFYPDLPKNYQISQYDLPLCFDGAVDVPVPVGGGAFETRRIGVIRAHLEEDAGKLLHELPGGHAFEGSIVDYNRAGTPLLEVVSEPDMRTSDEVVAYAQHLRNVCRFLGVSEGVMQKGHMRFEPNINTILEMSDGTRVKTPIVEIKNLNSFRALKGAIEYELADQPRRFLETGVEMAPGRKTTRGWDDVKAVTFVQREKEEAHDYRYFPDPDLVPLRVEKAWVERVRAELPELPHHRFERYRASYGLSDKEAAALVSERDVCLFFEETVAAAQQAVPAGMMEDRAAKAAANMILQYGAKRANERGVLASDLGITPEQIGGVIALRQDERLGSSAADELFGLLCETDEDAETVAQRANLLQVQDVGQIEAWVDETIADPANAQAIEAIKGGKMNAIGRLIGDVMKRSGGQADAKKVQELLKKRLT